MTRTYVLRALLAVEGVGAFVLWYPFDRLPWGLAGLIGTSCLLALWCTFPEPHRAGAASERLRVTPPAPSNYRGPSTPQREALERSAPADTDLCGVCGCGGADCAGARTGYCDVFGEWP